MPVGFPKKRPPPDIRWRPCGSGVTFTDEAKLTGRLFLLLFLGHALEVHGLALGGHGPVLLGHGQAARGAHVHAHAAIDTGHSFAGPGADLVVHGDALRRALDHAGPAEDAIVDVDVESAAKALEMTPHLEGVEPCGAFLQQVRHNVFRHIEHGNVLLFYRSVQLTQGSMDRAMTGTSASSHPGNMAKSGGMLANVGVRIRTRSRFLEPFAPSGSTRDASAPGCSTGLDPLHPRPLPLTLNAPEWAAWAGPGLAARCTGALRVRFCTRAVAGCHDCRRVWSGSRAWALSSSMDGFRCWLAVSPAGMRAMARRTSVHAPGRVSRETPRRARGAKQLAGVVLRGPRARSPSSVRRRRKPVWRTVLRPSRLARQGRTGGRPTGRSWFLGEHRRRPHVLRFFPVLGSLSSAGLELLAFPFFADAQLRPRIHRPQLFGASRLAAATSRPTHVDGNHPPRVARRVGFHGCPCMRLRATRQNFACKQAFRSRKRIGATGPSRASWEWMRVGVHPRCVPHGYLGPRGTSMPTSLPPPPPPPPPSSFPRPSRVATGRCARAGTNCRHTRLHAFCDHAG